MFRGSNNIIDNPYLIPYTNQTTFPNMSSNYSYDVSEHDQNPNSTTPQEGEDPPFSLNFPSPFLDDTQLFFNHIFPHHYQQLMVADDQINHETDLGCRVTNKRSINTINTTEEISTITTIITAARHHLPTPSSSEVAQKGKTSTNSSKGSSTQRKRGKKDRHSKIYTAQGLRDRRMRLSLQIARKFFDLQDMLGFDKASKTIDWLFSKSKRAIKQLSCTANHLPLMNNTVPSIYCQVESEEMRKVQTTSDGDNVSGERKTQKSRKAAGGEGGCGAKHNHIAKELRNKARARARERTSEKMMMRCLENSKQHYLSDHQPITSYNLAQLGSAGNPNALFEAGEEESSQEKHDSPYKDLSSHSSLHHQLANVGILDNFLGITASLSAAASCSIFDYDQRNDALLFSGKNPTSIFPENSSFHHFQSQNQAD